MSVFFSDTDSFISDLEYQPSGSTEKWTQHSALMSNSYVENLEGESAYWNASMFQIGAPRKGENVLRAASEKHYVLLKYCYNWTPVYSEIVGNSAFVNQVYTHSVKTSTQSIQNCPRTWVL